MWAVAAMMAMASAAGLVSGLRSPPASPLIPAAVPTPAPLTPPTPAIPTTTVTHTAALTPAATVVAAAATPVTPVQKPDAATPATPAPAAASAKKCTYPCANGGACVEGLCKCKVGFVGIDCSRRGCASNCNQRGYCDLSSTPPSCLCFAGWTGFDCELSSDPANPTPGGSLPTATNPNAVNAGRGRNNATGANPATPSTSSRVPLDRTLCKPACNPAHGVCFQGACACADGFAGETCEELLCPDDCSGHGRCDRKTGECECYRPYVGRNCQHSFERVIPRLVDTMQHVGGPHQLPLNRPESERVNRRNRDKAGLTDSLHLIEKRSRMVTVNDLVGPQ